MFGFARNRAYKKAVTEKLAGQAATYSVGLPSGGSSEMLLTLTLFSVMGRVAKLDGLVTEVEVSFASTIMHQLELGGSKRQRAIDYFEQGKRGETDVSDDVRKLCSDIGARSELSYLLLKILCSSAYAKGDMRLKEKMLLRDIAEDFGYDKAEFLALCGEVLATSQESLDHRPDSLRSAYKTLQLQPRVADGEIRKAYLKLMSRYHPDKLVRDNLSAESIAQAQSKFHDIRTAYEIVCGFRKLRV